MNRAERFWPNAKAIVEKVNKIINSGCWLYREKQDDGLHIINKPFTIDEEKKQISENWGGNSRGIMWGDGWNDSIADLRKLFVGVKVIQPNHMRDLKT